MNSKPDKQNGTERVYGEIAIHTNIVWHGNSFMSWLWTQEILFWIMLS